MAIVGNVSWQIQDADGDVGSLEIPFTNSTNSLTDILAWITTHMTPAIDVVTDGKVRKIRLSILVTLPGGLKANPVAGSEAQRSGLYTLDCTGTPNAFALVVPAQAASTFSANDIDDADADVSAFEALLTSAVSNTRPTDKYGNVLASVRTSRKTFRKR
jgi:hypothetical protein